MPVVNRIPRAIAPAFVLVLLLVTAADAGPRWRELGEYKDEPLPKPACPEAKTCQAVGHVTGYQVEMGKHKNPYTVNHRGKIVAFTIKLSKPNKSQTKFFTDLFGGRPTARISVLKKPKRDTKRHTDLRLVAQSEVFDLTDYLGSTPSFALSTSLVVPAHSTIALTVPTWAPAFATNVGKDRAWRSSRLKGDCGGTTQRAQQSVGTISFYDCFYRRPQLLYTVTFLRDPKTTKKG
jgi:hypothetical protein